MNHIVLICDPQVYTLTFQQLFFAIFQYLHLQTLLLVETGDEDLTKEVEFSVDNAEVLVSQSSEFDTWLNEVVFDLENFRNQPKKAMPRKAGGAVQAK